jgi:hypothetical protein
MVRGFYRGRGSVQLGVSVLINMSCSFSIVSQAPRRPCIVDDCHGPR